MIVYPPFLPDNTEGGSNRTVSRLLLGWLRSGLADAKRRLRPRRPRARRARARRVHACRISMGLSHFIIWLAPQIVLLVIARANILIYPPRKWGNGA
eukprot:COSAG01_NODE_37846_length_498_cov_0.694236_1_plen_97_part_00